MTYRWLADATVVLHFAFIAFVVLGSVLVWRRAAWAWLHVPAILWVAYIEFTGTLCPLTPLENTLRARAGDAGYAGGFIEHYLIPVIYPAGLTPGIQVALGTMVVASNALAYWAIWRRYRLSPARSGRADPGVTPHQQRPFPGQSTERAADAEPAVGNDRPLIR